MSEEVKEPISVGAVPKKPSGAQRKKDTRKRVKRDGVWRLDIWQPHAKVLRGKVRDEQGS